VREIALILVLALAGCDQVFDLQRPPGDAAPPDVALGAPPDAPEVCDQPGGVPDEDGDGFRNACDNCPYIAQGPNERTDADGDGVGDVCDRRPGQQDTLVKFVGFDDNNHGLRLLIDPGSGSWSVAGGALRATNVGEAQDMLARIDIAHRDVTVVTSVTLIAPHPAFSGESAGLWTNIDTMYPDPTFPAGNVFEVVRSGTMRFSHVVEVRSGSTNSANSAFNNELFVAARRYDLILTCQGTATPTCTATAEFAPNNQTVTISLLSAQVRTGAVGLRAYSTDLAFHYVAVYRHGP